MRRLSSKSTWFYKRVFPLLWFGFILVFLGVSLQVEYRTAGVDALSPESILVLVGLLIAGVGLVAFRHLIFDRVDKGWLAGAGSDGDFLVVKNRARKRRTAPSDVITIHSTTHANPRRNTVMLRAGAHYNSDMPASPRGFLSAFNPGRIASEPINRVDAARQATP